jgi:hypothetical protein
MMVTLPCRHPMIPSCGLPPWRLNECLLNICFRRSGVLPTELNILTCVTITSTSRRFIPGMCALGFDICYYDPRSQRVKDTWVQEWHGSVLGNSKFQFYNEVQSILESEKYLLCVTNRQHRVAFSIRLSSHNFEIETGKQHFILRENRYCSHCQSASNIAIVEDEIHVLYHYQLYDIIRKSCDLIYAILKNHLYGIYNMDMCLFCRDCVSLLSWLSKEEKIHWNCLRSIYCAVCQTVVYTPVSVYHAMCMHDKFVIHDWYYGNMGYWPCLLYE